MDSIFTRLINRDIPAHILREDDHFFSFLDIRPVNMGHALVIPKMEVDKLFDLDDELLGKILLFAQPIARAIEAVVPCKRVGLMVAGLEVPHAHIHLIPINSVHDLNFARAQSADPADLAELAEQIRGHLGQD